MNGQQAFSRECMRDRVRNWGRAGETGVEDSVLMTEFSDPAEVRSEDLFVFF